MDSIADFGFNELRRPTRGKLLSSVTAHGRAYVLKPGPKIDSTSPQSVPWPLPLPPPHSLWRLITRHVLVLCAVYLGATVFEPQHPVWSRAIVYGRITIPKQPCILGVVAHGDTLRPPPGDPGLNLFCSRGPGLSPTASARTTNKKGPFRRSGRRRPVGRLRAAPSVRYPKPWPFIEQRKIWRCIKCLPSRPSMGLRQIPPSHRA